MYEIAERMTGAAVLYGLKVGSMNRQKQLIIVRGGGDIATGTIHRLHRCSYPVLVLETGSPSAIRRQVAFSEAIYDGQSEIEGVTCLKVSDFAEAKAVLRGRCHPHDDG